jgi:nucleoside-diphosphate-sugar epimerase
MNAALIGHTGFVGGNLARQFAFTDFYNSKNIEKIADHSYDLIVCSGMPAAKWLANRDPIGDRAVLDRLAGCLLRASAKRVVIVSTVDVYPTPIGVDEDTPIELTDATPAYGKHRLMLERTVAANFPETLVVRLPALFGPGLKKNAIYDLLHNNDVQKIHSGGVFQFYNVEQLWADMQTAMASQLRLVNFTTEPVSIHEIAQMAFGVEFNNDPGGSAARYDMRSKHAELFGGRGGYLSDRNHVLTDLREFVRREREGVSS